MHFTLDIFFITLWQITRPIFFPRVHQKLANTEFKWMFSALIVRHIRSTHIWRPSNPMITMEQEFLVKRLWTRLRSILVCTNWRTNNEKQFSSQLCCIEFHRKEDLKLIFTLVCIEFFIIDVFNPRRLFPFLKHFFYKTIIHMNTTLVQKKIFC